MRNSSLQLPAWGNRIPTGIFYANWQSLRALKGARGEASSSSQTDCADGFCLFANKCVLTKWQSWVGTNFHLNLVVVLWNSDCLSPQPTAMFTPNPKIHPRLLPLSSLPQTYEVQAIIFILFTKKLSLTEVRWHTQSHTNSSRKSQDSRSTFHDLRDRLYQTPLQRALFTGPKLTLTTLTFSKPALKLQTHTLRMAPEKGHTNG